MRHPFLFCLFSVILAAQLVAQDLPESVRSQPQGDSGKAQTSASSEDLGQRLRHLKQAIQHLRAAGLGEEADRLEQQGRKMREEFERQNPRPARSRREFKTDFDPSTLVPFTQGTHYLDKYETGLYPGARNAMPSEHRSAGEAIAATIKPLDTEGRPDAESGRIIALALGHSNCREYFGAFQQFLSKKSTELHPHFELVSAAVGGQQLPEISRLQGGVWENAKRLLSRPGYSDRQVQVLFLHTTYHGAGNTSGMQARFPERMEQMQEDLQKVLAHCVERFPNLKMAFLTSDGFRHFTAFEPHVWQEAFGFKWLIESQIKGVAGTEYSGNTRKLPWLAWGPYIWDNSWDRSFFTDGVHQAPKAKAIVVDKLWKFLSTESVTKPWFLKAQPGQE